MLFSIAWKNIWRNKLRSLIVISAMTIGMIGGIIAAGVMMGASSESLKHALDDYASEIQIHHPKYSENNELKYYMENTDELKKYILSVPGVSSVSSRVKILGMISSPVNAQSVIINAIDPEQEKKVTTIHKKVIDSLGTYFKSDRKNQILISQKVADKLMLKVNSKLVLQFAENDSTYSGGAFRVCGIYNTNNSMFDGMNAFIKQADLKRISSLPQDIAHELAIRIQNADDLEPVKSSILKKHPDFSVMTWKEIYPQLALVNDLSDKMIYVFLIIILLALGFGIVNTMLMAVLERIKEFGMLMAVGMSKKRVFRMILYETVLLSSVGGIVGMIISALLLGYWGKNGINFSGMEQGFEKFGYASVIYPSLDVSFYFVLSFLIIITGVIASIYPARKAVRMNPVEALRTE
jgi:putative ABC transport system permease protein